MEGEPISDVTYGGVVSTDNHTCFRRHALLSACGEDCMPWCVLCGLCGVVLGVGCRVCVEGERENSGSCTVPLTPAHNVAIL
jgi:hypothetical protein